MSLGKGFISYTSNQATIHQLADSLAWGGSSGNLWSPSLQLFTAPALYYQQRHHLICIGGNVAVLRCRVCIDLARAAI